MAIAGVSDVYSVSNDLLNTFLGLDIAISQVYRVTTLLGEQISQPLAEPINQPDLVEDEVIYGSMDGSMILTDSGWQEVKLGRVFSSKSRLVAGDKADGQTRIKLSSYSAHLGTVQEFIPKFEASLGAYKTQPEQLVFITDGAIWIQHYIAKVHPKATHILDYYHAVEHLGVFARLAFAHPYVRSQWLDKQQDRLLSDDLDGVLTTLAQLTKLDTVCDSERTKLVAYYQQNRLRMQYGTFRGRGLLIGSGPMEAAHRTVIQCRMKRSGQRWTTDGAQAMLNLRVALKSDRWHLVAKTLNT